MQDIIIYIYGILIIIQGFFIGWIWKMFAAQKSMIESQKSIIDGFTSQSEHVKNLQTVITNLIKPETLENIVEYRVKEIEAKYKKMIEELEEGTYFRNDFSVDKTQILSLEYREIVEHYRKKISRFFLVITIWRILHPKEFEAYSHNFEKADLEMIDEFVEEIIADIQKKNNKDKNSK